MWKQEKAALEERKKTADLQKELAQERAVQELQRLQAEAGGSRREERVDWMYAAPAEGNGPNAEELEQYLLGKKRVDQLLKGNEEKVSLRSDLVLLSRVASFVSSSLTLPHRACVSFRPLSQLMAAPTASAPGGSFTSLQNANSARDTAAKIREDPLLAIKRQEQAQYERLLKNPKRLKELRAAREAASQRGGATPGGYPSSGGAGEKKSKKDETKEERRARKEAKRSREDGGDSGSKRRRDDDGGDRRRDDRDRSRSPRRSSHRDEPRRDDRDRRPDDYSRRDRDDYRSSRGGDDYARRDDRSRDDYRRPDPRDEDRRPPRHDDRDGDRKPDIREDRKPDVRRSPPPPRDNGPRDAPPRHDQRSYDRAPPPHQSSSSSSYRRPAPSAPAPVDPAIEAQRKLDAEARLAAMTSSAAALTSSRNARLAQLEAEDAKALEKEQAERKLNGGGGSSGVGPRFLRDQEKKVFGGGMDLGERMKRSGRVGMVGDKE